MKKDRFLALITDLDPDADETREVKQLLEAHPYSQVLQGLAARIARDQGWENQQAVLQHAAVCTTDRSVLKSLMIQDLTVPVTKVPEAVSRTVDLTDIAGEVMKDLAQLKRLKHTFELLFDGSTKEVKKKSGVAEKTNAMEIPAENNGDAITPVTEATLVKKPKRKKQTEDPLIEELKQKKKLKPVSQKHEEQLAVIDEFIKKKPGIKKAKADGASSSADHSATEFTDGIISETLVNILIEQDKKERAVEVLKKLIWKFPQKKAYFAARIEELKR